MFSHVLMQNYLYSKIYFCFKLYYLLCTILHLPVLHQSFTSPRGFGTCPMSHVKPQLHWWVHLQLLGVVVSGSASTMICWVPAFVFDGRGIALNCVKNGHTSVWKTNLFNNYLILINKYHKKWISFKSLLKWALFSMHNLKIPTRCHSIFGHYGGLCC